MQTMKDPKISVPREKGPWLKPPGGKLKLNCDASFSSTTKTGGWGYVIRDCHADVVTAGRGRVQFTSKNGGSSPRSELGHVTQIFLIGPRLPRLIYLAASVPRRPEIPGHENITRLLFLIEKKLSPSSSSLLRKRRAWRIRPGGGELAAPSPSVPHVLFSSLPLSLSSSLPTRIRRRRQQASTVVGPLCGIPLQCTTS